MSSHFKKLIVIITAAVAVAIIIAGILVKFVVYPRVVNRIKSRINFVISTIQQKTHTKVVAGKITIKKGWLSISDFKMLSRDGSYPIVAIDKITTKLSIWRLIKQRPLGPVKVDGVRLTIKLTKGRPADIIELWKTTKTASKLKSSMKVKVGKKMRRVKLSELIVDNASVLIEDKDNPKNKLTIDSLKLHISKKSGKWKGTLHGYLWIARTGARELTGQYKNREFIIKLTKTLELPRWLSPVKSSIKIEGLKISFKRNLKFAVKNVMWDKSWDVEHKTPLGPVKINATHLKGEEVFVSTKVNPFLPVTLGIKNLHSDLKIIKKNKYLDFNVKDLNGTLKLFGDKRQLNIHTPMFQGKQMIGNADISAIYEVSRGWNQIDLNGSGRWISMLIMLFDPHFFQLPQTAAIFKHHLQKIHMGWKDSFDIKLEDFGYFYTKLCLVPLFNINIHIKGTVKYQKDPERVNLNISMANINGIKLTGGFSYIKKGHRRPKIVLTVALPPQSCADVLKAIPVVMRPRLADMKVKGEISGGIRIVSDLNRPYTSTKLDADIDLDSCQVITLGSQVNLDMLTTPFVLKRPNPKKGKPPILIGPGTDNYVPLDKIPIWVRQAALATEDMGFYYHHGFKTGLIRRAIALDLDKGWYVYGGSTITQQLVKNLYLSTEKSLARKLEEAIITWQLEKKLDKDKILELYLNLIEYGKGIYGIKAAAKAYFNKDVSQLTPLEAAWIMATKPSPKYAWLVYKRKRFNEWWVNRMRSILLRLWKEMHVIDEYTFIKSAPYLPRFYYPDKGTYERPTVVGTKNIPKWLPKELPDQNIVNWPGKDIRPPTPPIIEIRRIEAWF